MNELKKISLFLISLSSCAGTIDIPFKDRTLLIDEKGPNLIYPTNQIERCKYPGNRVFRFCKKVRKVIKYDLNNDETRNMLIHSGFRCQSLQRFQNK